MKNLALSLSVVLALVLFMAAPASAQFTSGFLDFIKANANDTATGLYRFNGRVAINGPVHASQEFQITNFAANATYLKLINNEAGQVPVVGLEISTGCDMSFRLTTDSTFAIRDESNITGLTVKNGTLDVTIPNGTLTVGDTFYGQLVRSTSLESEGNLYINKDSTTADAIIYFGDDDEVVTLHWDDANNRFEFSGSSVIPYLQGDSVYARALATGDTTTGDADGRVYFADDNNWRAHFIAWDDGLSRWAFTAGELDVQNGSIILNSGYTVDNIDVSKLDTTLLGYPIDTTTGAPAYAPPTDGQVLKYLAASSIWYPADDAGGGALGDTANILRAEMPDSAAWVKSYNAANDSAQLVDHDNDTAVVFWDDDAGNVRLEAGKTGGGLIQSLRINADSLFLGDDLISEFVGTGLVLSSNQVTTTLGVSVDLASAEVTGTLPVGNGGTGAATLTDGGILLGSGTGAVTALAVATNGQIPIGDGATDPVLATITGTASEVTVTNGAGTITLSLPNNAGTDISADLEEETHASEHQDAGADEVAVTAGMVNAGTGASASTYFRGDNTWVTPTDNNTLFEYDSTGAGGIKADSIVLKQSADIDIRIVEVADRDTVYFDVIDDSHNHVITNVDAFTEAELETQLSNVTALFTNNVTGDVTVAGGASTIGANVVDDTHIDWGSGANQVDLADIPGGTAGASSFNFGGATDLEIPNGPAPTVNVEGEIAFETDVEVLLIRNAARSLGLATARKSRSFVIATPAAADDFPFWQTPHGIVLINVSAICIAGTNVVGQLQEYTGTATTPANTMSSDLTVTTTETTSSTFSDALIDAGDWLGWKTTSVSGSVTHFCITFEYEIR